MKNWTSIPSISYTSYIDYLRYVDFSHTKGVEKITNYEGLRPVRDPFGSEVRRTSTLSTFSALRVSFRSRSRLRPHKGVSDPYAPPLEMPLRGITTSSLRIVMPPLSTFGAQWGHFLAEERTRNPQGSCKKLILF